MNCILRETICAVNPKTSCYRFYFEYLFVYLAALSGTSPSSAERFEMSVQVCLWAMMETRLLWHTSNE